tara:strand:- start:45 stop:632 length:588 start_codon:yes stop_codon:yes gene_type:complete
MVRLLEPTYFPPISHWNYITSNNLLWSVKSNYNKQTLTNRTYIDSSNGELMLTVPIKHSGKNEPRNFSDIKIDKSFDWKKIHYKSIKISYQSSPFFEFYEDELYNFFSCDYENLIDLNLKSIKMVCGWLNIKMPSLVKKNQNDFIDISYLSNTKRTKYLSQKKYNQTFEINNGFISDLSILDLVFNCGPSSADYF